VINHHTGSHVQQQYNTVSLRQWWGPNILKAGLVWVHIPLS
jgi:hypothetical protein